jgi:hypothetical protein
MNKVEMFEYVQEELKKRGFVADPRGEAYGRSLYNPETKVSAHIGNIGKSSVGIKVIDMINGGMNWGTAYNKLQINSGTQIRFNFKTKNFETFFNTTFTNRVNKLNRLLEN